ncbi:rhomboid-like protein [Kitasatospora kifunensis]|uniref:Uncharacterized protein n=1 Tax=Kitasatospora kifunensis TaxID=58351 RepID=A0A7W7QWX6_KITKI|nr:rhomboid-like protein [Kitasatospora kifunensis]MBB4921306.1 hypothetical protein [Kitasatospora kifunensis]
MTRATEETVTPADRLRSGARRFGLGLARGLADYPRRSPAAFGYLVLLAVDTLVVKHLLAAATADRLLLGISTNLDNMGRHPIGSLFASLLVVDDGSWLDYLLIVGVGLAGCLALLERRLGTVRAVGVVLLGHVGATLVTTAVITVATRNGTYPVELRQTLDYGVSYASIAAVGAATVLLPRWARPWWAAAAVLYPLSSASWYGSLPGFVTIGHVSAALIGLTAAVTGTAIARRRQGN